MDLDDYYHLIKQDSYQDIIVHDKNRIMALADCYKNKNLILSVEKETNPLSEESLRVISIQNSTDSNNVVAIVVSDEYRDADINNPILWLHLVVEACEWYEEANDYLTWRQDFGFKDNAFFQDLYTSLKVVVPKTRELIGYDVKAVDHHHIEFNTDVAQALRNYEI